MTLLYYSSVYSLFLISILILFQNQVMTLKCSSILENFFLKSETFLVKEKSENIEHFRKKGALGGKILGLFKFDENSLKSESEKFLITNTAAEIIFKPFRFKNDSILLFLLFLSHV